MTRPTQYKTLHAGRAAAALLIVIFHANLVLCDVRFWGTSRYSPLFGGLALSVQFFFVLSGIVMMLAHTGDFGRPERLASYAWKRFRRVYPIYWVVTAAWLVIYIGFAANLDARAKSPLMLLSSFLLIHIGTLDTALSVGWTLFHEVLFYIFFALVILNRKPGQWVLILWMVTCLPVAFLPQHPLLQTFFSPLHLLFGTGILVAFSCSVATLSFREYSFASASPVFAC